MNQSGTVCEEPPPMQEKLWFKAQLKKVNKVLQELLSKDVDFRKVLSRGIAQHLGHQTFHTVDGYVYPLIACCSDKDQNRQPVLICISVKEGFIDDPEPIHFEFGFFRRYGVGNPNDAIGWRRRGDGIINFSVTKINPKESWECKEKLSALSNKVFIVDTCTERLNQW